MITHVAIKDSNGKVWSLPKPNRHGNIFLDNKLKGIDNLPLREGIQGFLNDKGEFLDRKQAFIHVQECKQEFNLKRNVSDKDLYSEGVW